jgi:hypothetical protein
VDAGPDGGEGDLTYLPMRIGWGVLAYSFAHRTARE